MGGCRRVRQSPQCYTLSWWMSHSKWAVETTKSQRKLYEKTGGCGKVSPVIICLFFALFISCFRNLEPSSSYYFWSSRSWSSQHGLARVGHSENTIWSLWGRITLNVFRGRWGSYVTGKEWERVRVVDDGVRWGSRRPYYSRPWCQSIIRTVAFILNKNVEIWAEEWHDVTEI